MGVAGGRLFLRLFFGNRGSRRKTLPNSVSLLSCGAVQRASDSAPTPRSVQGYGCTQGSQPNDRSRIEPPDPPWDPRLPEIGTGAQPSQYASNTVRKSESPTCVPAGVVGCVSECTRENTQYNDDAAIGLVTQ